MDLMAPRKRRAWVGSLGAMGVRAKRGAFNPATLFSGGVAGAWYDPSDMSTLYQDSAGTTPVTASGQPVGKMLDKSGNGNHLTQGTSAARPIFNDVGGVRWLEFDGVDDVLSNIAVPLPTSPYLTALLACRFFSGATTEGPFQINGGADGDFSTVKRGAVWESTCSGSVNRFGSTIVAAADEVSQLDFVANSTAAAQLYYKDGVSQTKSVTGAASTTTNASPTFNITVGRSAGAWTNFRLYGKLFLARALAISERQQLTTYLAAKQGRSL